MHSKYVLFKKLTLGVARRLCMLYQVLGVLNYKQVNAAPLERQQSLSEKKVDGGWKVSDVGKLTNVQKIPVE